MSKLVSKTTPFIVDIQGSLPRSYTPSPFRGEVTTLDEVRTLIFGDPWSSAADGHTAAVYTCDLSYVRCLYMFRDKSITHQYN